MGGEKKIRPGVVHDFVDIGDQLGAAHGWLQGGDQHSVVAPRLASGNGAGGVSADSIGDQPLARFGRDEVATDLAAKLNFPLFRHRPLLGRQRMAPGPAIHGHLIRIHVLNEGFSYLHKRGWRRHE